MDNILTDNPGLAKTIGKVTKKEAKVKRYNSAMEDLYRSMDEVLKLGANKVKLVGEWAWAHFQTKPADDILHKLALLGFVYNKKRQWYQRPALGARVCRNNLDTEAVFSKYQASDWFGR